MILAAFLCTVAYVSDGDTWRCQDGTRVRLHGVDAPETGPCPRNRVCAPGDGQASKRALERLISGQTVRCEATGRSYERITAWCRTPAGVDLSCEVVRLGAAVVDRRYWGNHRC